MITKITPISLAEVKKIVVDIEEKKDLVNYIKKFENLDLEKTAKLSEEIRNLNNLKIKEEHVVKIVDFVPKNSEELNKIFTDVSLDEEESKKILEIVGSY